MCEQVNIYKFQIDLVCKIASLDDKILYLGLGVEDEIEVVTTSEWAHVYVEPSKITRIKYQENESTENVD